MIFSNQKKPFKYKFSWRTSAAVCHDFFVATLAWYLSYLFRFNFNIPADFEKSLWEITLWLIPLQVFIFVTLGLYKSLWRFASLPDLMCIIKSVVVSSVTVVVVIFMFKPFHIIPRSVLLLDPVFLFLFLTCDRLAYRCWKEYRLYGQSILMGKPVLILGAGEAAVSLCKELARGREWRVVGFLDDDVNVLSQTISGVKVLGPLDNLPEIAHKLDVDQVIVSMPLDKHQCRVRAVNIANDAHLNVLTVPAFDDLISGKLSLSQIRHVEVEDLLGREPVNLDDKGLQELISGQVVMVTGAGGSIGSELCLQIRKYQPRILLCYDISEFALYTLEQEFSDKASQLKVIYVVGDVKNEQRLLSLMGKYQPSVVFHAAAYKHVPLMENDNVAEALHNNVAGTYTLAKVCQELNVKRFVLISTDKAVNPTNVMGASKRLAEMVCQGLQGASATIFAVVRFGNVLGSSGSVIPKFRQQIAMGGPVTVTHPDITRYFMSIPEASQLVMQAGLMSQGGEIFVLDMGESVKIADLAREMIKLSGFQEGEIEVKFTGLRPGEKLYEELLADDEHTLPTPHPKLRVALARAVDIIWVEALLKWIASVSALDEDLIKQQLKLWVEEYTVDVRKSASDKRNITTLQSTTLH